jgi:ketosteroid isomerase-like protein
MKGSTMSTDETRTVVERHMAALQSGTIDNVMEDYTDESVFIINLGGVFKGRDAIRPFFEGSAGMPGFTEIAAFVEGDAYYVTWTADGIDFGSDTIVVKEDKIALQTVVVVLAS